MFKHLKNKKGLATIVVAMLAGLVSAKWMAQGNPLVTLPWGALAFLVAFAAKSKREALTLGGCLGFVAAYSYLLFDHTGTLTLGAVISLVFLIILPALLALLCGMLCAWLGWLVSSRLGQRRTI